MNNYKPRINYKKPDIFIYFPLKPFILGTPFMETTIWIGSNQLLGVQIIHFTLGFPIINHIVLDLSVNYAFAIAHQACGLAAHGCRRQSQAVRRENDNFFAWKMKIFNWNMGRSTYDTWKKKDLPGVG